MPHLTTPDGLSLHYTDTGGEGRPLVLIHGWPLSGSTFNRNAASFYEAGLRVITYDRRGFGESGKPDSGYDYDTLAADTASLLEYLDLHDAVVLGFSMGGGEAAKLAGRHNERVAGVIFSGSITPALCISDNNPDGAMPMSAFEELSRGCAADRDAFLDSFITTFYSTQDAGLLVDEEIRGEALQIARQSGAIAAPATILIWATDLRAEVAAIKVPTLVLHGDGDQNVPLGASSARMPELVPHAELVVLKGAPHGANDSHAEQWEGAILDFVSRLD
ncbi:Pimeloyl-ACP methyl ester carboxylesterase [Tessaracoccus bendigoensis DSM 12906]|uniref:Pimeloyl-ACP methyl ester carboxylesterase n=1 Tax=Tessaracoccus bendigoensis DSM 12906 TaxID=1123357 RepID=A0A1M6ICF6_9ACTN|nr:alpha/beta hydrolase [Tessaracoccus bendigoensis]SHJ32105.1 Pimeloyl-ACP methyl ester carboxylesterase [Tessaracoccus bendigoensis DSM 12906]